MRSILFLFTLVLFGCSNKSEPVYNLEVDPMEESNLVAVDTIQVERMKPGLDDWQRSVVKSLNGGDY